MNRIALGVIPLAISVACYWALSLAAEDDTRRDHKPGGVTVKQAENPFGPYEFLIGEWDVKSEIEGSPIGIQRVRWGPNRSYIWYALALLSDGREEPHLEGMLVWNGVHKNLDMLFVMDLKSGRVQEQGTMSAEPDGSLVRNITAVYSPGVQAMTGPVASAGATAQFRQTYKQIGSDKIQTSAMRRTERRLGRHFSGKRSSAVGASVGQFLTPLRCASCRLQSRHLSIIPVPHDRAKLEIRD